MKCGKDLSRTCRALFCLFLLATWAFDPRVFAATNYQGQVTFNSLPVPGVTVSAAQGTKKEVSITDQQGEYSFPDLPDGVWKFQVQMEGFATQTQDVTVANGTPGPSWQLKLLSLAQITHGAAPIQAEKELPATSPVQANGPESATEATPAPETPAAPAANGNSRPAANNTSNANNTPPPQQPSEANGSEASSDLQQSAATGLVVNGSVNNGAASPFSQAAAFGNNRRGPGLLYNGNAGVNFDTSAWDSRNFSPGGLATAKPSYNQVSILGNVGGPIGIPGTHHYLNSSNMVIGYQHGANDTASAVTGLVPTLLERGGNFSQSVNSLGQPVVVYNPATNQPYSGDTVPVSTQAQSLLNQYPMSNVTNVPGINYETSGLTTQHSDGVQVRLAKYRNRNQFFGNFGLLRQAGQNNANIFGYQDSSNSQGLDAAATWQRIYRPGGLGYLTTTFKYEFNRLASSEDPFFENRTNISGQAGIQGNDQSPQYWGPPTLLFSSGIAGLSDANYSRNADETQTFTYQTLWYRGKHSLQFGADVLRQQFNANTEQIGRGEFSFTGAATQELDSNGQPVTGTGSDLADFLIGVPDTAEIAFGNADKYLRGWRYDAFIQDDWRMKSGFTLDVGVRWEFATPVTELQNRLSNLDVAPGFTAAAPVTAADPTGAITGEKYPNSLLHSDYRGVEPRLSMAWRPRSNSPLVIRAGYGIYDITSIYQVIAMQMAQQPPFSKNFDLSNSAATPLALGTAFNYSPAAGLPTFGVDPNFRIGYAQIWDASLQQDLPGSLVMTATYTGTRGSNLMQEYMPNMYPTGSPLACPSCPSGFVYLTSNGFLNREAAKVQLRRRLRNGLTATLEYTYAKATDDASAFSGAAITGNSSGLSTAPSSAGGGSTSIAQNWQNLRAETSPSPFDQRHLLTFSGQYTTGEGLHSAALLSGWRATAFKDWTFVSSLTVGSGLPITPIYESQATGIGVPWIIRPDTTGASVTAAPVGLHLNPAAFAAPAAGQFGDAGRDSITGPAQFSLSAGFNRTFRLNSRIDATWETQATNILNRVTPSSWVTNWNSPAFGSVAGWDTMRKLSTTIRVRF
ncbi:MAG TPA: TonB-dependent receptor [Candidatus Aquilonibacter sp.]|nr:TonB-dependent receptor [Candidatus Aquilonibacter sp.]